MISKDRLPTDLPLTIASCQTQSAQADLPVLSGAGWGMSGRRPACLDRLLQRPLRTFLPSARLRPSTLPPMPDESGTQRAGAVDPASPMGHYVDAPAAALVPLFACREFPKSRPAAGAMLISPMLFIISGARVLVSRRAGAIKRDESARCAVRNRFSAAAPPGGAAEAGVSRHRRRPEQAEETRASS